MKWKTLLVFLILLCFSVLPLTYAVTWNLNGNWKILDSHKWIFGSDWISTSGTDITITDWFIDDWVNYTCVGSGTQELYHGSSPSEVYLDGVFKVSGDGWTYGSGTVSITGATFSAAILFTYVPPAVTVNIIFPQNVTYPSSNIPVEILASGGTINSIWYNCKNGSNWIFGSNQTYTVPTYMANFINGTYHFYAGATNTDGNRDEADVWFSVAISPAIDNPPYQGAYSVSTTLRNTVATFTCQWFDDNGLDFGILAHNASGIWDTNTPVALTGLADTLIDTQLLPPLANTVLAYRFYANDSAGQWGFTPIYYLTTTAPPTVDPAYSNPSLAPHGLAKGDLFLSIPVGLGVGCQEYPERILLYVYDGWLNSSEASVNIFVGSGEFRFVADTDCLLFVVSDFAQSKYRVDDGVYYPINYNGMYLDVEVGHAYIFQWAKPIGWMLPLDFILGLIGLVMTFAGPVLFIVKVRNGDYKEALIYGFLFFTVGIGLLIAWLW